MKTLFLTNEYPPTIYGGAGVHVDYLSRELAKLMEVEVRCYGKEMRELRVDTAALKAVGFGLDASGYTAPLWHTLRHTCVSLRRAGWQVTGNRC